MTSILLTGASGFLGRAVLSKLVESGHEVDAVSLHPVPGVHPNVRWHQVDLLDRDAATTLVSRCRATHLVHLAWHAKPPDYVTSPVNQEWERAGRDLISGFAVAGGERVIGAGTCLEYDLQTPEPLGEDSLVAPTTPYGSAKSALREWMDSSGDRLGISGLWIRFFYLYGPREHPDRLIPYVIRCLLADVPAKVSQGDQARDFVFVEDAADAVAGLIHTPATGAINVASGTATPVREVVDVIAEELGKHDLVQRGAQERADALIPVIQAEVSKLRDLLGWTPSTTLREGLSTTIEWWRAARERRG